MPVVYRLHRQSKRHNNPTNSPDSSAFSQSTLILATGTEQVPVAKLTPRNLLHSQQQTHNCIATRQPCMKQSIVWSPSESGLINSPVRSFTSTPVKGSDGKPPKDFAAAQSYDHHTIGLSIFFHHGLRLAGSATAMQVVLQLTVESPCKLPPGVHDTSVSMCYN